MYSGARDDGQNAHDFCALPFLAKAKRSIGWHPSCAMVDGLRVLTGRWVARVRLVRRKRARVCVTSTSNRPGGGPGRRGRHTLHLTV